MSVSLEKKEKNMAVLTVEIEAAELVKALQEAYMKEKGRIQIPGFRKGKAPRKMIEKLYGKTVFYEEAANILLQKTYDGAVAECGETVVSRPRIDISQIEEGKNFIYTAEVALKPEVSLGQYKGVEVPKREISVSEDEVNAEIERERDRNSRMIDVDDRPVQDGDRVKLDFDGSVDGVYGARTQSAVKAFQKSCGITADGIAGPTTLLYLGLSSSSSGYSSSDEWLLAKLIAAEARGESYKGQVAVGAVVLNRVAHPSFPDSVSGVIYQKGAFSCVNDSNWSVSPNATSQKAARDAINGWDPSGGAIYYYNPRTAKSQWIRTRPVICTIGNHVFCS